MTLQEHIELDVLRLQFDLAVNLLGKCLKLYIVTQDCLSKCDILGLILSWRHNWNQPLPHIVMFSVGPACRAALLPAHRTSRVASEQRTLRNAPCIQITSKWAEQKDWRWNYKQVGEQMLLTDSLPIADPPTICSEWKPLMDLADSFFLNCSPALLIIGLSKWLTR